MKVQDLPGWSPHPFASFNLEKLTWEQMAAIVHMFWREAKRRNPIGINMYEAAFSRLAAELEEIAGAERANPTCEAGPTRTERKVIRDIIDDDIAYATAVVKDLRRMATDMVYLPVVGGRSATAAEMALRLRFANAIVAMDVLDSELRRQK